MQPVKMFKLLKVPCVLTRRSLEDWREYLARAQRNLKRMQQLIICEICYERPVSTEECPGGTPRGILSALRRAHGRTQRRTRGISPLNALPRRADRPAAGLHVWCPPVPPARLPARLQANRVCTSKGRTPFSR